MKLRIVQKQIPGYCKTYHLQRHLIWFIWYQDSWSDDLEYVKYRAKDLIQNTENWEPDKIIWTWPD